MRTNINVPVSVGRARNRPAIFHLWSVNGSKQICTAIGRTSSVPKFAGQRLALLGVARACLLPSVSDRKASQYPIQESEHKYGATILVDQLLQAFA